MILVLSAAKGTRSPLQIFPLHLQDSELQGFSERAASLQTQKLVILIPRTKRALALRQSISSEQSVSNCREQKLNSWFVRRKRINSVSTCDKYVFLFF